MPPGERSILVPKQPGHSGTCIIWNPLENEKQCWIIELLDYRGQFVRLNQWLVPENLGRFRRMLVYTGARLGRFPCNIQMNALNKSQLIMFLYTS